ncbi:16S rRNA (cytosine(1402)-N(4))-methyltransferase [PVC group bacterium (ex Bugula neritina AB1)]|nr:16S rRNA (cytosine(1402)-N(4))-methyltransferase [PVC group bacterium (ex Bugula neritina AB1)]
MSKHIPVLLNEVIEALNIQPGGSFVDGTLGCAGHSKAILEKAGPEGCLIGIDRDKEILEFAKESLQEQEGSSVCVWGNYKDMKKILENEKTNQVDGILLDLGVSSFQIDTRERGFSFMQDAELDMRMNPNEGESVQDLLHRISEKELADILYEYADERRSRRIAKLIVEKRKKKAITRTSELAELAIKAYGRRGKSHPATRTFQALRIAVNNELENLHTFFQNSLSCLKPKGRLCIISYHSLEDRAVKLQFREWAKEKSCELITKKPIVPNISEVKVNNRSRSAKMRICEKL